MNYSKIKDIAYVAMSADLIHQGHINIIKEASKLGSVTIGLLTDKAISTYKKLPFMTYEERLAVISNIKGVDQVISQETTSYIDNLNKIKPKYVVHGDDWKQGIQSKVRQEVIDILSQWGGELVEPPYSYNMDSLRIYEAIRKIGITPNIRLKSLKRLINAKPIVRFLDAHNGLTGSIIENVEIVKNGVKNNFDGMWCSSLTESTARAKPDIEAVDISSRSETLNQIIEVTTKPIIFDGDTGGLPEHFVFSVRKLERLGVSAVIIEDKIGLKKNSLLGNAVPQYQDTIENFSHKINAGKLAQVTNDFMIIARIESLILEKGLQNALDRAKAYIDAGADGIMIHSKDNDTKDIFNFCKEYNKFYNRKHLVIVPSSFSHVKEKQLIDNGVQIVIYANHLIRAAYPSMINTAKSILLNSRAQEIEKDLMSIKNILDLIPGTH